MEGGGAGQDGGYFGFGETVEELAHPDGIEPRRERHGRIEQIRPVSVDARRTG